MVIMRMTTTTPKTELEIEIAKRSKIGRHGTLIRQTKSENAVLQKFYRCRACGKRVNEFEVTTIGTEEGGGDEENNNNKVCNHCHDIGNTTPNYELNKRKRRVGENKKNDNNHNNNNDKMTIST